MESSATTPDQAGPEPEERAAFRAEARAFLEANAPRREPSSLWSVSFHTDEEAQARAFDSGRRWQRTLFDHGFAGLTYPVEYGGQGGSQWQEAIFRQESADFAASSGYISSTMAMLGPTLLQWGTEDQKEALLPRLLSGEDAYCQLFSEPGAGSDLASLATRAVRDGDEFVVNGQKVWNSAAQYCTRGMLLARTDPDAPKHRGITFLLVDMGAPGVECRPFVQANGAREFNEVFLNEVRVPVANVLGEINEGWPVARTVLANEAAFIGGAGGGDVTPHARLRVLAETFGRTDDPLVRQDLATSYIRERILRFLGERMRAAARRPSGRPLDPAMLKLFATESRVHDGALAMSIMGAGAVASAPGDEVATWAQVELLNRFAFSIGGGTSEVQRNNLAERALGLPREPGSDHKRPWKDVPRS